MSVQNEVNIIIKEIYEHESIILSKYKFTGLAQEYISEKVRKDTFILVQKGKMSVGDACVKSEQAILDNRDYLDQFKLMLYETYLVEVRELPEDQGRVVLTI